MLLAIYVVRLVAAVIFGRGLLVVNTEVAIVVLVVVDEGAAVEDVVNDFDIFLLHSTF